MFYSRKCSVRSPRLQASLRRVHILLLSFALSAMLISGSRPGFAALQISDDQPHAALWKQLYDQLPDVWKTEKQIVVQEISSEEMARLVSQTQGDNKEDDNSVVDGCYEPGEHEGEPDTIMLLSSLKSQDAGLVFTHEYGHFVWDNLLNRSQRNQYRHIWRDQKADGHLVTRYAAEDVEEGFAEAFAFYLRRPGALKRRDTTSCKFFNGLLPKSADYDAFRISVR